MTDPAALGRDDVRAVPEVARRGTLPEAALGTPFDRLALTMLGRELPRSGPRCSRVRPDSRDRQA